MSTRYGIDWTGDCLRAVRPRNQDSLVSFDLFDQLGPEVLSDVEGELPNLALAFPGSESRTTVIKLPDMIDWQARALFELSQSLLEPIDTYRVVLEPSGLANQIIATLIRKSRLRDLAGQLGCNGSAGSMSILPRALALAAGFRNFCDRPDGDLLCLLDVNRSQTTICLTYRDQPLLCGTVQLSDESDDADVSARLALDLRTWTNLQLESLGQLGVSASPDACVVTGESSDSSLLDDLAGQFHCPVIPAAWQLERAPLDSEGRPLATAYLVALGTLAK